ncbi:hypothetical protein COCC4DRAFT_141614 [Bipolaris maydis ATCC 48331]|uniref:Secreted protein n=2 Tax=Cochliobolus heterostrophus TaxID=5016 RepID=M2TYT8_COCH5|nr:uncharacterized protein COCC4DRAFT_141614 [Bipolaris maydis ATCC 48331]EMD87001.1 hypothetical protein COCHEDRAFT_1114487 [Bipolaris maydis C5]ENI04003.1 hypothetical protein COCC4DRAFT_141614 [Bipolaris maydis ATCC 48331]KAJ6204323.1 hypothetical protein PSV09DRAFT_1114487 [Bipolaris maydis]
MLLRKALATLCSTLVAFCPVKRTVNISETVWPSDRRGQACILACSLHEAVLPLPKLCGVESHSEPQAGLRNMTRYSCGGLLSPSVVWCWMSVRVLLAHASDKRNGYRGISYLCWNPKACKMLMPVELARPHGSAKPHPFMLSALLVFCRILPSYLPYHSVCMKYTLCNSIVALHIFLCSVYRLSWPANLVRGTRTWDSFL